MGGAFGRGCSSVGLDRVSDLGSAGRLGEAVWVLGPLVGVERSSRISMAGISGKSAKSMDPVGSAAGWRLAINFRMPTSNASILVL